MWWLLAAALGAAPPIPAVAAGDQAVGICQVATGDPSVGGGQMAAADPALGGCQVAIGDPSVARTAAVPSAAVLMRGLQQRDVDEGPSSEPVNRRKLRLIGLSLLAPGLAHLTEGEKTRGIAYLAADVVCWSTYAGFRVQGGIRKDAYIDYAEQHAGIQEADGRSSEYYQTIASWPNSALYNEFVVAREARDAYPDDLAGREAYYQEHRVPDDQVWDWESQAAQDRFRSKRNHSESAYRSARTMAGLAVVNRVVAMLDAVLFLDQDGRERAMRLDLMPGPEPGGAALCVRVALP